MAYDQALYKAVEAEYEEIRRENDRDLKQRRQELFASYPSLEQIDSEIKMLGLKLYRIALTEKNKQEAVRKLRDEQKSLIEKRNRILTENGYPTDALSERYRCNDCRDTGSIGTYPCACYKRMLVMKAFEDSNLVNSFKNQTFRDFDLSMYPEGISEKYNVSVRNHMQEILTECMHYAEQFDNINYSMLFSGNPGLGKTFLSTCIAKDVLKSGHSVIYETSHRAFTLLEQVKFRRGDENEQAQDKVNKFYTCDLLVLDDLGSEFHTQYANAALFDVLNNRLISEKKTIINTNLSLQQLEQAYGPRIASRIIGNFKVKFFIGEDIRRVQSVNAIN